MRALPAVLVSMLLAAPARASSFEADFDTGTPADGWSDLISPSGADSINYVAAAAHRGAQGLRVVDDTTSSSSGATAGVSQNVDGSGPLFMRFWFRAPSFGNVSEGSRLVISQVIAPGGNVNSVLDLSVVVSAEGGNIIGVGPDVHGTYFFDQGVPTFQLADWHLVEVALHGLGGKSGQREVFVDGQRSGQQTNLDWTGLGLLRVALGEPWADDRSLTATLDFDDFRMSDAPLASRLALTRADGGSASCAAMDVGLQDVYGAAAAAPYDVEVALTASSGARLFSDASCAHSLTTLALAQGQGTSSFYVSGGSSAGKLDATAVDFLSAETTLDGVGATNPTRLYDLGCSAGGRGPASGALLSLLLCLAVTRAKSGAGPA